MRTCFATALACLICLGASGTVGSATPPKTLLAVGDSLSIGTDPHLRRQLPGYRIERSHQVGLRSPEVATRVVSRTPGSLPSVLVVSAGTNDDPRAVPEFSQAIADVLGAAGGSRCVVWPTIARPPVGGVGYWRMNRALSRAATQHGNLVLVDWALMVRRDSSLLSSDGVHAASAGYRARAAAIATAVTTRCRS